MVDEIENTGVQDTESPSASESKPDESTGSEDSNTETTNQTDKGVISPEEKPTEKPGESVEGGKSGGDSGESVVPEKYDIRTGENSFLNDADLERIGAEAKELGLSNEEAQDLVNIEDGVITRFREKQDNEVQSIRDGWAKSAEKDKEIGGDNFKENVALSKRVIDRFGSKDFQKALDETGFGNHPEVIRMFTRIGKLMSNDKMIHPKAKSSNSERTIEDIFYGENK